MKKQFSLLMGLLFLCPLTAIALPIGTGDLTIVPSASITSTNYYGDYDVTSYTYKSGTEIKFAPDNTVENGWEAFCISNDTLTSANPFTFYASAEILTDTNTVNFVTSVANWATTGIKSEDDKRDAQMAIWQTLSVTAGGSGDPASWASSKSISITNTYVNDWLVAINGGFGNGGNQDFLIKAAPVPEPTVTMLFALGAVGFAGMARRRMNR